MLIVSKSTTPTPSTILQGTRGLPPLVRYPCPWGHYHSSEERAAHCSTRLCLSSSAVPCASPANSTSIPASSGSFGGISALGRTGGDSRSGMSPRAATADPSASHVAAATADPTTTGHDWFGTRRRAALQAGAAPLPTAPPPAPVIPPYVAQIDPYNSLVDIWYVVMVGTRVGVFSQQ